ncbi:MAG: 5'-methylthioadenosine/S-adenosylhomocysteine nucleosidase [Clostridia bacterium]|nr:5'-methylthioadenosine/S-adenosylhomocysteine nucleosidase [Clostridia bacterium]
MKQKIGFLFADSMEFKPFSEIALADGGSFLSKRPMNVIRYETENAEIIAVESGLGKVNAAFAATLLIVDHQVDAVLNAGLSGAIQHLHKGDVVAGTSYVECDFDISPLGFPAGEKPDGTGVHAASDKLLAAATSIEGVSPARLGTGDFFLADPVKKEEYRKQFDIEAFDMETAALATVCDRLETPFLAIRKISDDAGDVASDSYLEMNALAETALSEVLLDLVSRL